VFETSTESPNAPIQLTPPSRRILCTTEVSRPDPGFARTTIERAPGERIESNTWYSVAVARPVVSRTVLHIAATMRRVTIEGALWARTTAQASMSTSPANRGLTE
jgi:hypothetical protein